MTRQQQRLETVAKPHPQASVIAPPAPPAFQGDEAEDLLCGNCLTILSNGCSARTIKERFLSDVQLLVLCPTCTTYNVIPVHLSH